MPKTITAYFERDLLVSLQSYGERVTGGTIEAQPQWRSKIILNSRRTYSPYVDLVVGPFAVEDNITPDYSGLVHAFQPWISSLESSFIENQRFFGYDIRSTDWNSNQNPRCFIAIEIEKSGSKKHLIGDLINVSALGKIGVVVAWDTATMKSFLRILDYFLFLERVRKPVSLPMNVVVVSRDQIQMMS